jgi:hypothetical protein
MVAQSTEGVCQGSIALVLPAMLDIFNVLFMFYFVCLVILISTLDNLFDLFMQLYCKFANRARVKFHW